VRSHFFRQQTNGVIGLEVDAIGLPAKSRLAYPFECDAPPRDVMADLVPIPLALFSRLERAGLDVDAVLRRAQLPKSRFNVAKPQGTTAEFFALWRAVEETNPDPSLGLQLGIEALTDQENVVALAALHSPTLGEGLHKLARYKRLVCPERITIHVKGGEARLLLEWLFAERNPPTLLTDLAFSGLVNLAQHGTKEPVTPLRVELTRRKSNETMLRRHFRCELRFDAPHDLLVFDEADLALPMVNRNAQLLAVLMPGLELAVTQDNDARTLTDDVRVALSDTICGDRPAIAKVARSLGMSSRTMQRRLEELGTTYQDVLDDVRRRLARRLLENTDLGMGEVAFLLGFEEVNSFSRAFHSWERTTPARWRARTLANRSRRRPAAQMPRRAGRPPP
jgi:AraC-like DNA-binding protein